MPKEEEKIVFKSHFQIFLIAKKKKKNCLCVRVFITDKNEC